MSIKTITFYHRVNGVLTDAAAVALSDIDAVYGVRRRDTLADLPGFGVGTTIPNVATGTYQIVLTGLAEGAPYEFRVRATYQGVDRYGGGTFVAPAVGTEYVTELDLDLELGSDNADLHADLNNEAEAFHITTMRLDAISVGILRTDLKLMSAVPPPVFPLVVTNSSTSGIIALAARKYAACELLNKRSKQARIGTGETLPGDAKCAEAEALLDALIAAGLPGVTEETGDTDLALDAPIGVFATVDARGCEITTDCTCN